MIIFAKYGWYTANGDDKVGWFLFDCCDSWHTDDLDDDEVLEWAKMPDNFLERWMAGEDIPRPDWQQGTPPDHGDYFVRVDR